MIITIDLENRSYSLQIEKGCFQEAGAWVADLWQPRRIALVTDEIVGPLYASSLIEDLSKRGFTVKQITIPAGEESKSFSQAEKLYGELLDFGLTRKDGLIALGGGVVGDLTGFIASTYQRGVPFLQIPTTLLSQVDSSIGGKTAINLPQGKNLVGTFYQPEGVLIDPDLLATLPLRRLREGLAEVIKYGAIADAKLFKTLEDLKNEEDFLAHSVEIIATCCSIKKNFVEKDERDLGLRFLLNFGHTIGHGIEQVTHYKSWAHGEAVAIGMNQITSVTENQGATEPGTLKRLQELLQKFHLPLQHVPWEIDQLTAAISRDKKGESDQIRMVRLKKIGEAELFPVGKSEIPTYLQFVERDDF